MAMTAKLSACWIYKRGALIALGAACLISAPLMAQDAANAKKAGAASSAASDELAEVVVTAERRTQNLQKAAISATVLSAEDLANKGVVGLSSVQYAVPGVIIADYGSANT